MGRLSGQRRAWRPDIPAAPAMQAALALAVATILSVGPGEALAQPSAQAASGWQACIAKPESTRLACFDDWARAQAALRNTAASPPASASNTASNTASDTASGSAGMRTETALKSPDSPASPDEPRNRCQNAKKFSHLTRVWELQADASCDTFNIRGYRPIIASFVVADTVNRQPESRAAGHTAAAPQDYGPVETRLQLSVRTKLRQNLLTSAREGSADPQDSLWVGYTQQSYWQVFKSNLSRPFRTTDHEPEFFYVYPHEQPLGLGWKLRYSGAGISHQSNGQDLPLSRSWNRGYLMAGLEGQGGWRLEGRAWKRLPEGGEDDNPGIADLIGRAELTAGWDYSERTTFQGTLRHPLRSAKGGSVRLEWFNALGKTNATRGYVNDLRLHTMLFHGYGDSLIDFNRKRTVLSLGLSLVDW